MKKNKQKELKDKVIKQYIKPKIDMNYDSEKYLVHDPINPYLYVVVEDYLYDR